jgi:hypothetical protein
MSEIKTTSNSSLYKKLRKRKICNKSGKCTICPMHGGENTSRKGKYGKTKPKYKNKRK